MTRGSRILLLCDNPGKEYISRIHTGMTRCNTRGSFVLAMENLYDSRNSLAEVIADDSLAGIVLTPPISDDRHALSKLEARRLPYVRIAPLLDSARGSNVVMDEFDAARAVVDVMLSKGHRRIAILRGPSSHLVSMRRYNGYAAALGGKGLRVDQSLVAQGEFTRESGRAQAARLFAAKPTAIFSSNDEMALGIIDAANASGISIPGSISLVGYDDNPGARTCRPPLTTVRQPLEKMGESACGLLVERIRSPGKPHQTVTEPYEVIERQSVAEYREERAA